MLLYFSQGRGSVGPVCGRFALFVGLEDLAKHFGVTIEEMGIPPRNNISPTLAVSIIRRRADAGHHVTRGRWGLIPFWAKDPSIADREINVRADTAPEKPAFRAAVKRRHLLPAFGFSEWQAAGGKARSSYASARGTARCWPLPAGGSGGRRARPCV